MGVNHRRVLTARIISMHKVNKAIISLAASMVGYPAEIWHAPMTAFTQTWVHLFSTLTIKHLNWRICVYLWNLGCYLALVLSPDLLSIIGHMICLLLAQKNNLATTYIYGLAFLLAHTWQCHHHNNFQNNLTHWINMRNQEKSCIISIVSLPIRQGNAWQTRGQILECNHWRPTAKCFLQLRINAKQALQLGDCIWLSIKASPRTNLGYKHYQRPLSYYSSLRLDHVNLRGKKQWRLLKSSSWLVNPVMHARKQLMSLYATQTGNLRAQGYLFALLFAEQRLLSIEEWQALRLSSTAHLMAVSGLHIQMLQRSLEQVLMPICSYLSPIFPKRNSAIISSVILILYSCCCDHSSACVRAVLMQCIPCLYLICWHKIASIDNLILSGCLQSLLAPQAIYSNGFILSYSMAALLIMLNYRYAKINYFTQTLLISTISTPLSIIFWGSTSLISPVANAIAVPWMSKIILPLACLSLLSGYHPTLQSHIFIILEYNFILLSKILTTLAQIELTTRHYQQLFFYWAYTHFTKFTAHS